MKNIKKLSALLIVLAMMFALAACTNDDGGYNTDDGTLPNNDNNDNGSENDGETPENPDNNEDGGINQPDDNLPEQNGPNNLSGSTFEGTVYSLLGQTGSVTAGSTSAGAFLMVTQDGKHYYVNGGSYGGSSQGSGASNGTGNEGGAGTAGNGASGSSGMGADASGGGTGNGAETGNGASQSGSNAPEADRGGSIGLGDTVEVTVGSGSDNGGIVTVNDCTVTVKEKFSGTMLEAKVYTKEGVPTTGFDSLDKSGGWYHQRFADYPDFGAFLDKFNLRDVIKGITDVISGGEIPDLNEDFFKSNTVHIFAVREPGGTATEIGGTGNGDNASDAEVYKDGDTLYLKIRESGFYNYIGGLTGNGNAGAGARDTDGNTGTGTGTDSGNGTGTGTGTGSGTGTGNGADNGMGTGNGAGNGAGTGTGTGTGTGNGTDTGIDNGMGTDMNDGTTGTPDTDTLPDGFTDAPSDTPDGSNTAGETCRIYIAVLGNDNNTVDKGVVLVEDAD